MVFLYRPKPMSFSYRLISSDPRSTVIFFKENLKHERECAGCFWFQFGNKLETSWEGHSLPLWMPLFCQYYTSQFTDLWCGHEKLYVVFCILKNMNNEPCIAIYHIFSIFMNFVNTTYWIIFYYIVHMNILTLHSVHYKKTSNENSANHPK